LEWGKGEDFGGYFVEMEYFAAYSLHLERALNYICRAYIFLGSYVLVYLILEMK